jgi:hypothetical protein
MTLRTVKIKVYFEFEKFSNGSVRCIVYDELTGELLVYGPPVYDNATNDAMANAEAVARDMLLYNNLCFPAYMDTEISGHA